MAFSIALSMALCLLSSSLCQALVDCGSLDEDPLPLLAGTGALSALGAFLLLCLEAMLEN